MGPKKETVEIVGHTVEIILREVGKSPRIGDIAETIHLSRQRICRCYRQVNGESLGQAKKMARLQFAAALLIATDLSVGRIAKETSFVTSQALDKAFRQVFQVTPSEYRVSERARVFEAISDGEDGAATRQTETAARPVVCASHAVGSLLRHGQSVRSEHEYGPTIHPVIELHPGQTHLGFAMSRGKVATIVFSEEGVSTITPAGNVFGLRSVLSGGFAYLPFDDELSHPERREAS